MKKDKIIITSLVIIIVMLIFNMFYSVYEMIDYNNRKESGNARWEQVEKRIVTIEKELDSLKNEVERWKK